MKEIKFTWSDWDKGCGSNGTALDGFIRACVSYTMMPGDDEFPYRITLCGRRIGKSKSMEVGKTFAQRRFNKLLEMEGKA